MVEYGERVAEWGVFSYFIVEGVTVLPMTLKLKEAYVTVIVH